MSYIFPNIGINMKLKRKFTINLKKIQKNSPQKPGGYAISI